MNKLKYLYIFILLTIIVIGVIQTEVVTTVEYPNHTMLQTNVKD